MRLEALHTKKLVKAKKIIADLVTNQLVLQVSSIKKPKMFDSLTKLFEEHTSEDDLKKLVEKCEDP